jgi:transaldolase
LLTTSFVDQQTYKAYRDILASDRWQRLANFGARPQRLLFASTGIKDPKASGIFYIAGLAAPNTIDTIPEKTLLAFADHGKLGGTLRRNGGDCETVLDNFRKAGIDFEQRPSTCNRGAPSPSMNRGKTCSVQSRPRATSCSTLSKR